MDNLIEAIESLRTAKLALKEARKLSLAASCDELIEEIQVELNMVQRYREPDYTGTKYDQDATPLHETFTAR